MIYCNSLIRFKVQNWGCQPGCASKAGPGHACGALKGTLLQSLRLTTAMPTAFNPNGAHDLFNPSSRIIIGPPIPLPIFVYLGIPVPRRIKAMDTKHHSSNPPQPVDSPKIQRDDSNGVKPKPSAMRRLGRWLANFASLMVAGGG